MWNIKKNFILHTSEWWSRVAVKASKAKLITRSKSKHFWRDRLFFDPISCTVSLKLGSSLSLSLSLSLLSHQLLCQHQADCAVFASRGYKMTESSQLHNSGNWLDSKLHLYACSIVFMYIYSNHSATVTFIVLLAIIVEKVYFSKRKSKGKALALLIILTKVCVKCWMWLPDQCWSMLIRY